MTKIVWEIFFWPLHFQWWSKFQKKVLFWLKRESSLEKQPIVKVERFLKDFWPKQNMQNSAYTKTFTFKILYNFVALFHYQRLGKGFEVIKSVKNWSLKETGMSYEQKIQNFFKQNWTGLEKFWYLLLNPFWRYC